MNQFLNGVISAVLSSLLLALILNSLKEPVYIKYKSPKIDDERITIPIVKEGKPTNSGFNKYTLQFEILDTARFKIDRLMYVKDIDPSLIKGEFEMYPILQTAEYYLGEGKFEWMIRIIKKDHDSRIKPTDFKFSIEPVNYENPYLMKKYSFSDAVYKQRILISALLIFAIVLIIYPRQAKSHQFVVKSLDSYVFDYTNSSPLDRAKVQILSTPLFCITKASGHCSISRIELDYITVQVTKGGYVTWQNDVEMASDGTTNINVSLVPRGYAQNLSNEIKKLMKQINESEDPEEMQRLIENAKKKLQQLRNLREAYPNFDSAFPELLGLEPQLNQVIG